MSGTLSQSELDLYRTQPQSNELFLSIYKPNVILACRINNSAIAKGARSIAYNSVSSGSYANILSGYTLWVGSTPGGKDLGKVRVRSATATYLTVAENSDVRWANGKYLTVVDVIDIVPVFPRIIKDPSNEENTLWYKDYDIAYTNQNDIMGTFINMGPHRAGKLDDLGECKFWFGATGTTHVNNKALSYLWEFPGADGITGSTALTPGWVTYKTAQHTHAKLQVTGANGSVDVSYRYVSVYPKNNISKGWSASNFQGSRPSNGYAFDMTIYEPWNYEIYEGAAIVIYTKAFYGNTQIQIGGNSEHNSNIFLTGYILQNSIKYDYQKSSVSFKVGSASEVMKLTMGFAISVENSITTPTTWYQIKSNNLFRSIYHFLRWHSTVLMTTDFQFLATDRFIQYFDSDRTSVFDAINSVMKSALLGEIVCDRQGKLWAETSVEARNAAKTYYTAKFTVIKDDWIDEPIIQEEPYDKVSYIELGGIQFTPTIDGEAASVAYLACAPGTAPSNHGKVEAPTGLALQSQAELNKIVGNVFAAKNARIPTIDMNLRGSFLCLDIAPINTLQVEIAEDDTSKHKTISNPYFVDALTLIYNSSQLNVKTNVNLKEITEGVPGDTIIIPIIPPTDFPTPIFDIPPFPPFPPLPPIVPPVTVGMLAILVNGNGLFYIDTTQETLTWASANTPFDIGDYQTFRVFDYSSYGVAYVATQNKIFSTIFGSEVATLLGGPSLSFPSLFTVDGDFGINSVCVDKDSGTMACFVVGNPDRADGGYLSGAAGPVANAYHQINNGQGEGGASTSSLWYFNGKFYLAGTWGINANEDVRIGLFSSGLSLNHFNLFPPEIIESGRGITSHHATAADVLYWQPGDTFGKFTNDGASVTAINSIVLINDRHQQVACDPTGEVVWALHDEYSTSDNMSLKQSVDGGDTWTTLANPAGEIRNGTVLNLGTALDWLLCYNDSTATPSMKLNVWRTIDGGVTWIDYLANLASLLPDEIREISMVRYA